MVNIIFLGAPGSGKGTQAALLSKELNIPAISTGEILRKELAEESQVGILAKSYMDSGKLVPDEVVVNIIKKRILEKDCKKGFILDGFPRNLSQGKELDKMLNDINRKVDIVLDISVPDEVIIKRISGRFSCEKCGEVYNRFFKLPQKENVCDNCSSGHFTSRNDDKEETVVNRLKVYNQNTKDLVFFYEKKGLIYKVDGLKNILLLSKEIVRIVSPFLQSTIKVA